MSSYNQSAVSNRLLRALPASVFDAMSSSMQLLDLPLRYSLVDADQPTNIVCFIESGLASVVAVSSDNENIEVGHVGFEGMTGGHVLLKVDKTPNKTFMQTVGKGIQVPSSVLLELVENHPSIRDFFLRYVHCCEIQLAQSALANARYSVYERLARWLLMCHDRLLNDDLPLTHEFLSIMLGVRRSGVTDQVHILEGMHAIRATRGNIRILNRPKLEDIAGGCYGVPEREYDRLIGPGVRD